MRKLSARLFIKILPIVICSVSFSTAAENPVGDGALSANEALDKCLPKPQSAAAISPYAYGIDGHQWLTLRVAMAATRDYSVAHGIAYYTQYPDIDTSYEAVGRAFNILDSDWQQSIMNHLHSLHGGDTEDVQRRRAHLSDGVAYWYNMENQQLWQIGLMNHALGDSYAHTKGELNGDDEKAYGIPLGHAYDSLFGRNPDAIKNQKYKAIEYAKSLYTALSGTSEDPSPEFDAIIYEIESCNYDQCNFLKGFYHAQDEDKNDEEMGMFTACMNRNAKKLTKEQVLQITEWVAN